MARLLAAILTGKPAFVGTDARDTVRKAANAELSDVFARLDACGADADLIAIAKRCLSADRDSRPTDGRAVAAEVRRGPCLDQRRPHCLDRHPRRVCSRPA